MKIIGGFKFFTQNFPKLFFKPWLIYVAFTAMKVRNIEWIVIVPHDIESFAGEAGGGTEAEFTETDYCD
jgi:hypothetical protein